MKHMDKATFPIISFPLLSPWYKSTPLFWNNTVLLKNSKFQLVEFLCNLPLVGSGFPLLPCFEIIPYYLRFQIPTGKSFYVIFVFHWWLRFSSPIFKYFIQQLNIRVFSLKFYTKRGKKDKGGYIVINAPVSQHAGNFFSLFNNGIK